jgi:7,8-dihydropterin-6-yl-methyl-4-(beta-D-ribofuranosyl)aminobenzene 5'-phosphate synthase
VTAAPIAELDELSILIIVDNETDTLSSVDERVPQHAEIEQLLPRVPAIPLPDGHAGKPVFDRLCCAGHGFSALITGYRGTEAHSVLFDAGPYPQLWMDNAERLGVDLASIEAVFLSHWHFDYSGALPAVINVIAQARAANRLEPVLVDVHPDRPDQRGILLPNGTMILLPAEPSFDALAPDGARLLKESERHSLGSGFFLGSGPIGRVTEYETGLAGHHSFRGNQALPDPLLLDERFLAARVRGRGTTVLSACSHAGVVNVCLAARRDLGDPIDAIVGGYHLSGRSMESRIPATVSDLQKQIRPRLVAPGHCTGWRAKTALATAFSPGRYGPSVVGSLYRLRAPDRP